MTKPIDKAMDELIKFFPEGKYEQEVDSFLVVNFFEGSTAVLRRIGVWAVQTLKLAKDLGKIDNEFDERMRTYLDSKENK